MQQIKILWADDEIDLLKPQVMFLEQRGYKVDTVTNGHDALAELETEKFDLVLLDESMPGISGLDTLAKIKENTPNLPVVLITKNEAEDVMNEALGAQIDDYLIKPVNPNQVLLSIKKITEKKGLIQERTTSDYQQEFQQIFSDINQCNSFEEWFDVYKRIVHWELRLDQSETQEMEDILTMQKNEANLSFSKFVEKNYASLLNDENSQIPTSPNLFRRKVFPLLQEGKPVVLFLLDNLRYDQWKIIEPLLAEYYNVDKEEFFLSILPTCTQYSRNAIFAGMSPLDISKNYKDLWVYDHEQGGKNKYEAELLSKQVKRLVRKEIKHDYLKVLNVAAAKNMSDNILNYLQKDLSCIVYNFIDMLSHARTEMEVIKELASDEKAYRSLTKSWFQHSPLLEAFKKLSERDATIIITTDHGTIRVNTPSKVVGDKQTTTNLRYKSGRNLNYNKKDVLAIKNPENVGLPMPNISSSYIFAKDDAFFLYPNNYNHYHNFFKDTFQHGGISMEEMICPFVTLSPK